MSYSIGNPYTFARALIAAAHAYESSYDHKAADEATQKAKLHNEAIINDPAYYSSMMLVDFAKFYTKDLPTAIATVAQHWNQNDQEFRGPIEWLLRGYWNDALDWANLVLAVEAAATKDGFPLGALVETRTGLRMYIAFSFQEDLASDNIERTYYRLTWCSKEEYAERTPGGIEREDLLHPNCFRQDELQLVSL